MNAKPVYENIADAPFKIGQRVKVTSLSDDTAAQEYLGEIGEVRYFEYDCGCGQTYPHDPMIGVVFRCGSVHEFWKEELTEVRDACINR